jgi:hypothetical protein
MLSAVLKYVLSLSLEMHALALPNVFSLSQARPPPLALSKIDESTLERVRPPTLVDLMVVGEESLNPTVEIGLDEWMILSVYSLTPSLKS